MNPTKTLLRISVKDNGRYRELDNGPFPISSAELMAARNLFTKELSEVKGLGGARHSPQTAARDILLKTVPHLSDFDRLMLGFAVTNTNIKYEVVNA